MALLYLVHVVIFADQVLDYPISSSCLHRHYTGPLTVHCLSRLLETRVLADCLEKLWLANLSRVMDGRPAILPHLWAHVFELQEHHCTFYVRIRECFDKGVLSLLLITTAASRQSNSLSITCSEATSPWIQAWCNAFCPESSIISIFAPFRT